MTTALIRSWIKLGVGQLVTVSCLLILCLFLPRLSFSPFTAMPKPSLQKPDDKAIESLNTILQPDTIRTAKATKHVIQQPSKVQTTYGSRGTKGLARYSRRNNKRDASSSKRSASSDDSADAFQEDGPPRVKRARRRNNDRRQTSDQPDTIPTLFVGSVSINELSSAKANSAKNKADVEEKHKLFDDLSRQSSQLESADDADSKEDVAPKYGMYKTLGFYMAIKLTHEYM